MKKSSHSCVLQTGASLMSTRNFSHITSQYTNTTIIQLGGGVCVRVWRRWGSGATPSWPECCCWRWERRAALLAAPSGLGPARSASAETCPPLEPAKWPPHRLAPPPDSLTRFSDAFGQDSRHCSRSSAGRRVTPRRTACSSGSTGPGSAARCSPRRAPVVPERTKQPHESRV